MDQLAVRLIAYITQQNNPTGMALLGLSAFIEYVFPPFPGDTITLLGAFLITAHGWSFPLVFLVVLAGSGAGALCDFWLGLWLKRRELANAAKHPAASAKLAKLVERFRRHGAVYLVINRFLPGVRALFFVAAGMAGLRARAVLFWALVSAALWNLLLIAIGCTVGRNFGALRHFLATYSTVVWIALATIAVGWLARTLYRRFTSRR